MEKKKEQDKNTQDELKKEELEQIAGGVITQIVPLTKVEALTPKQILDIHGKKCAGM